MENAMCWNTRRWRQAGVLIVLCCFASIAWAQWAWRDERGRPVYSDVPPPPGIKPGAILQQPTLAPEPSPSDSSEAPQPGTANAAPRAAPALAPTAPTMAEREQEFRKRMKDRADAEKKQADQQAQLARNAEDCQRARGYMKSLEDGIRLVRTNPDGGREMLDESQRDAEAQRTQQMIQDRCK